MASSERGTAVNTDSPGPRDKTAEQTESDGKHTRRDLLKAGVATFVGGSLVGGFATAEVTADGHNDGDTKWGSSSNRDDYFADHIDATSITAGKTNNVPIVRPGDDLQSAIDSVYDSNNEDRSGTVRLETSDSNDSHVYDLSPPIAVKPGVMLDASGAFINQSVDATELFELKRDSVVLGHGLEIYGGNFTGDIFLIDGDNSDSPLVNEPAHVFGYPKVRNNGPSAIYHLKQSSGASIGSCILTAGGENGPRPVFIENDDGSGFINNNTFALNGSFDAGTDSILHFTGSANPVRANEVYGKQVQIKGGDHFLEMGRGKGNYIHGQFADIASKITNTHFEFQASARAGNVVEIEYANKLDPSNVTNNSGEVQIIRSQQGGMLPQDLSGKTGLYPGMIAVDDGTNTTGDGKACSWDATDNVWVPSDDLVPITEGSKVSIGSGGTSVVSHSIGADTNLSVSMGLQDPDNDIKVEWRTFWDNSANETKVEFNELAAAGGGVVRYSIFEQGGTFS